jgi:hypothetical protein
LVASGKLTPQLERWEVAQFEFPLRAADGAPTPPSGDAPAAAAATVEAAAPAAAGGDAATAAEPEKHANVNEPLPLTIAERPNVLKICAELRAATPEERRYIFDVFVPQCEAADRELAAKLDADANAPGAAAA